jgi:hypothetical protein
MELEVILGLVGSGVTVLGVTTVFIFSIVKAKKELRILADKEASEQAARLKAEKQKFYLTTASNLVVSADKLALSGPQKKEYVMTWLENEAVKAGIEVDKALMSVSIERTILIMNDFKDKGQPVSSLLKVELDDAVEQEQLKIDAEASRALNKLNADSKLIQDKTVEGIALTQNTMRDVKHILNKK